MTRSVLIVDDDPFIRRLIATTLEDVAGFDIEEAADGAQAVTAARSLDPAIVFLDIDMPRMNGIEACRQLRALDREPAATIVMLTAAGPDAEAEARAAGADLFLTKPFSPLDLLELVSALAERR
jgi:two-component system chemotaxis response regulator CheY